MNKILVKEAIKKLKELKTVLTEECHYQADQILLDYLYAIGETEVAEMYEKVRNGAGFMYA